MLGMMLRDVDTNFSHYLDGKRVDITCGLGASTGHTKFVASGSAENAFCQV